MDNSNSRFKFNPVEIAVFLLVLGGVTYSAHQFTQGTQGEDDRSLASISEGKIETFKLDCKNTTKSVTQSPMIRIQGTVCVENNSQGASAKITNQVNQFSASVLPDASTQLFESELIPLEMGHNPIRVEFTARDGKTLSKVLDIQRETL